jgi:hypothetical protein
MRWKYRLENIMNMLMFFLSAMSIRKNEYVRYKSVQSKRKKKTQFCDFTDVG